METALKHWHFVMKDEVAVLSLDSGPPTQNTLCIDALRELERTLAELSCIANRGCIGVVITSAKKNTFCAGAHVPEIKDLLGAPEEDIVALLTEARRVFSLLMDFPVPTIAAISGECFGGGLELALSCEARVAADERKTSFALPEVQLGIIPGFGGTQTLPPLVGYQTALEVILGGKKLSAKEALRAGLVDKVVANEHLVTEAILLARALAGGREIIRSEKRAAALDRWSLGSGLTGAITRHIIVRGVPILKHAAPQWFSGARDRMLKKTKGIYPAAPAALRSVENSADMSLAWGWDQESQLFAACARTPEARNLVTFYLAREEARKSSWGAALVPPPQKVGVVGAGVMGAGIAHAVLSRDGEVVLHDLYPAAVAQARIRIEKFFKGAVQRGIFTAEEAVTKYARLTTSYGENYAAFSDVDFALEAVAERRSIKRSVYDALVRVLPADAVLATNTSSLPLQEMAGEVRGNNRFLALHFFNPVRTMDLVEVAGHAGTSPETLARALALVRMLKKTPVVLAHPCNGFIVNRILSIPLSMSLQAVLERKVTPYQIDRLFEGMGMVMGPFRTIDLVGFDIALAVLKSLVEYADRPLFDYSLMEKARDAGMLGAKSGKGFYLYDSKEKETGKNEDFFNKIAGDALTVGNANYPFATAEEVVRATYARMQEEARRIVAEGIAEAKFVNLAVILGAGITPNKGGLRPW